VPLDGAHSELAAVARAEVSLGYSLANSTRPQTRRVSGSGVEAELRTHAYDSHLVRSDLLIRLSSR
jgi:hypothetical protein